MGFKTVRGSQNKWWKDKGGKEATFELISRLNNGENIAVTVDGPSGPLHQVKNGVIKIAKLTGAPIIPVGIHGTFKPFSKIHINYGEPIDLSSYKGEDKEKTDEATAMVMEEIVRLTKIEN